MEYLVSITALEVAAQVVQPEFAVEVTVGGPGSPGTPGQGVPVGGTAGQVLEKIDGTDYNTQWVDAPGGAVDSVNGQTGVVVLTQDNVGDGTTYKQYSQTEKTKLAGIEAGAQVNVNADWNAASGDAEILNKPAIPSIAGLATVAYVDTQDALKVDKVAGKSLLADTEISRLASMTAIFTTALQAAYDGAVSWIAANGAALIAHLSNMSNPHNTTAVQVGAEPTITGGLLSQYWTGLKTWVDFGTSVRAALLTGYIVGSNVAILATDSVLEAFQKIQGQINAILLRLLPAGGTTGQVLAKVDGTDYNVSWQTASGGIGGSGTTGTIPAWTAGTTLGDSPITRSGTKVAVNGAAFLRQFNVYGPVLDARMFFHTDPGGTPGIELATDSTGTRRALIRMAESGTNGSEMHFFTRPTAGGAVVQVLTIQENGQIRNLPMAGTGGSSEVQVDNNGALSRGAVKWFAADATTSTVASSTAFTALNDNTKAIQVGSLNAAGKSAIFEGSFTLLNNTGSAQSYSFRINEASGSAFPFQDTIATLASSASQRFCTFRVVVTRLTNTTYLIYGAVNIGQPGTPTAGRGEMGSGGITVYNFGAAGTLSLSRTFSGSTNTFSFDIANGISSASMSFTILDSIVYIP